MAGVLLTPPMSRIEPNAFNPSSLGNALQQSGADASASLATGQFAGRQLILEDGPSVLSDAAEEISLHHSEKAEAKHSAERKKEATPRQPLMSPEAIQAYMDASQSQQSPEELVQLAKRLLSGHGNPSTQAKQAFREPTQQFLALQYALQQGERDGADPVVLDALRDALDDLEMDYGPQIRADINTIGTASQHASSAQEVAAFQSTYRDVVLGNATLAGTLQLALARFGDTEFSAGLERLKQALGQDLAAARPSAEPTRLQSLVQDLYHLSVASTVLEACHELQAQQAKQHGVQVGSAVALMQDLVQVSAEKWVSASRFTGLADKSGAVAVAPQISFLTGVKALLHQMPVQIFVDADQRQGVFQAVQEALDAAIDREEY